ncbi:hypothetical protein LTR27_011944 [Elasticomyces elasticus]|nr:hypothetical protein LTR27_011944 [Elasticomyces elasticus]
MPRPYQHGGIYGGGMFPFGGAALTGLYQGGGWGSPRYGSGSSGGGGGFNRGFWNSFGGGGQRSGGFFGGGGGGGRINGFGGYGNRRSRWHDGGQDHRDWSTNHLYA